MDRLLQCSCHRPLPAPFWVALEAHNQGLLTILRKSQRRREVLPAETELLPVSGGSANQMVPAPAAAAVKRISATEGQGSVDKACPVRAPPIERVFVNAAPAGRWRDRSTEVALNRCGFQSALIRIQLCQRKPRRDQGSDGEHDGLGSLSVKEVASGEERSVDRKATSDDASQREWQVRCRCLNRVSSNRGLLDDVSPTDAARIDLLTECSQSLLIIRTRQKHHGHPADCGQADAGD